MATNLREQANLLNDSIDFAYMRSQYKDQWILCVEYLLQKYQDECLVEEILKSKIMRWADDGSLTCNPSLENLKEYERKFPKQFSWNFLSP